MTEVTTRTFTVTVLDSANRAPIEGALVTVYPFDEQQPRTNISGYTNSQGQFSFTVTFPPSAYIVTVEKAGYYSAQQRIDENTQSEIAIGLLSRPQTITVRVVNQSNNSPIVGAQVVVIQDQIIVTEAITDASGEAQFTLLPYEQYTIQASAFGFQPGSVSVNIPLPNPIVTISLVPVALQREQRIIVRVVEQLSLSPIPGAQVLVIQDQTIVAQGTTNASGEVQFVLPYGTYTIQALASGYQTGSASVNIPLSNPVVTLSLERQIQTITVRVLNQSNNDPIAGAQVIVSQGQTTVTQGTTNDSGEVQFTLVYGATYTILASATGYNTGSIIVTIPLSDPVVVIGLSPQPPVQILIVRVVDARNNRPLAHALVMIKQGQSVISKATTDTSGEALFTLPYGTYTIEVSADGYNSSSSNITIPLSVPIVIVRLAPLGERRIILLTVLDSLDSTPVSGALVRVSYYDESGNLREIVSGYTNSQGQFSFTAISTISYELVVEKQGYIPARLSIDQSTPSNVTITLQRESPPALPPIEPPVPIPEPTPEPPKPEPPVPPPKDIIEPGPPPIEEPPRKELPKEPEPLREPPVEPGPEPPGKELPVELPEAPAQLPPEQPPEPPAPTPPIEFPKPPKEPEKPPEEEPIQPGPPERPPEKEPPEEEPPTPGVPPTQPPPPPEKESPEESEKETPIHPLPEKPERPPEQPPEKEPPIVIPPPRPVSPPKEPPAESPIQSPSPVQSPTEQQPSTQPPQPSTGIKKLLLLGLGALTLIALLNFMTGDEKKDKDKQQG